MQDLLQVVKTVKKHAQVCWGYNYLELKAIRLCKIDIARDFKGSFIVSDQDEAFEVMSAALSDELRILFSSTETNFLSANVISDLSVTRGGNSFASCLQFDVNDDGGVKLLTIKVYDKVIDLISRDGSKPVGSKTNVIVGAKLKLTELNQRVRKAASTGMTRLEVSIHNAALQKYEVTQPSFKTVWHMRVIATMDALAAYFLNDEDTIAHCYHKVAIPTLLNLLSRANANILAIGKKDCWIVNARTPHPRHFVGTQCSVSIFERPMELCRWYRLKEFAAKYASAGSTIRVFWLHQQRD